MRRRRVPTVVQIIHAKHGVTYMTMRLPGGPAATATYGAPKILCGANAPFKTITQTLRARDGLGPHLPIRDDDRGANFP